MQRYIQDTIYDYSTYIIQDCIIPPILNTKRQYDRLSDAEKKLLHDTLKTSAMFLYENSKTIIFTYNTMKYIKSCVW